MKNLKLRYLITYKLFEDQESLPIYDPTPSEEEDEEEMFDNVNSIMLDCVDDYDVDIELRGPSECFVNSLQRDVVVFRVELNAYRVLEFNKVKLNVDHLISYMKSVGYSNFIYRDDGSGFNISITGNYPHLKQNILPEGNDRIDHVLISFIKD